MGEVPFTSNQKNGKKNKKPDLNFIEQKKFINAQSVFAKLKQLLIFISTVDQYTA
jgi:hypothetical protein